MKTYLVGGAVRDMLLGRKPKDFDVGTDATPGQVRKLFRNCFLVGKRFRLAHIGHLQQSGAHESGFGAPVSDVVILQAVHVDSPGVTPLRFRKSRSAVVQSAANPG